MRRALILAALALLATACGAEPEVTPRAAPPAPAGVEAPRVADAAPSSAAQIATPAPLLAAPAAEPVVERCREGEERTLRRPGEAWAAFAVAETVARTKPGGRVIQSFPLVNENAHPMLFGVLSEVVDEACQPVWYRVQLPIRPNGSTGYIRASDVVLEPVPTSIVIDLSDRRLELFRDGDPVEAVTVAIGSELTPTPTGRYYVNQRFRITDPGGPLGPAALGISGFSPVLVNWPQGGPIAIHGTNRPESVGQAASNGCLRVDNETLLELFDEVPAGTPVTIRA